MDAAWYWFVHQVVTPFKDSDVHLPVKCNKAFQSISHKLYLVIASLICKICAKSISLYAFNNNDVVHVSVEDTFTRCIRSYRLWSSPRYSGIIDSQPSFIVIEIDNYVGSPPLRIPKKYSQQQVSDIHDVCWFNCGTAIHSHIVINSHRMCTTWQTLTFLPGIASFLVWCWRDKRANRVAGACTGT